jgi:hypothetical protein
MAEAWLAATRLRRKLGTAMAVMIRMMATTINNSMSEKPRGLQGMAVLLLQTDTKRKR